MNKIILIFSLLIFSTCFAEVNQNNEELKYIIIARHGQTDFNKNKLLTGRGSNPDLNEEGINQAMQLGEILANKFKDDTAIELIVSTNMKRTNQTTNIVNKWFGLPVVYDISLQEVNRGQLEGKPLTEVLPIIQALPDDQAHPTFGGESTNEFKERVTKGVCKYYNSPEKVILIIAHGFVGETASHYFKNESVKLGNTDYIILDYKELSSKCS